MAISARTGVKGAIVALISPGSAGNACIEGWES